jgi:Nif-specific regulatory protein
MIGKTPIASKIRSSIIKLKDLEGPVLIHGEPGVGKTLLAEIIHFEGRRGLNKLVKIHCGGMTEEALELKIFGGQGPEGQIPSAFELAKGGTIILHEVQHLTLDTQARLIKTLNEGILGAKTSIDARLLATSTSDIQEMVVNSEFNKDLHDYLSQAFVFVDPLRKRRSDVKFLVDFFLKIECKKQGLLLKTFTEQALTAFTEYDWPGNVAELRKCVERAVLYNPKAHIIGDLSNTATPLFDKSKSTLKMFDDIPFASDVAISLKDRVLLVERKLIDAEIKRHNNNKSQAAKIMGISREALRKKILQSDEILKKLSETTTIKKAA